MFFKTVSGVENFLNTKEETLHHIPARIQAFIFVLYDNIQIELMNLNLKEGIVYITFQHWSKSRNLFKIFNVFNIFI